VTIELDLDEPFERAGIWWLPSEPQHQLAGTLRYSPDGHAVLELVGTFGGHPFAGFIRALSMRASGPVRYETIHGMTVDGKVITLLRAVQRDSQINMPGLSRESYLAVWTLVGLHCANPDDEVFQSGAFRVEGLDAWLGRQPFEEETLEDPRRMVVTCTMMDDLSFGRPASLEAEVFARMSLHTDGEHLTRFGARVQNVLEVCPDRSRSLQWHIDQVERLSRLVELCTGAHLPLRSIRLYGPDRELEGGMMVPQEVDILLFRNEPAGAPRAKERPIFTGPELLAANPDAIESWLQIEQTLQPVLDLFFTVVASRKLYSDVAFLLMIQAWEVHHRLTSPGALMDKAGFKTLIKTLVASIPPDTPSEMKAKLESSLSFANEPSLRQRIGASLAVLEPVYGPDAFGFDAATIKTVVDSRNYYTHYSSNLKTKALKRGDLIQLTRRMTPLLYALILPTLGLSPETVREHLRRRQAFGPYLPPKVPKGAQA
jgi:hypothetical protein